MAHAKLVEAPANSGKRLSANGKGRYIGARGRSALQRYKYSAVDHSVIGPYFQPFWTGLVTYVPPWVAPNCITVGGLLLVVLSCCLTWAQSPQLDVLLPTWLLLAHAGLLFWYQTLDALDGKQARRTGSSGPLGELCDHTCDALVCSFEGLAVASTLLCGAGGSHTALAIWLVGTWPFCLATWRMYHTGVMTLPEFNGPNEGLALLYCTHAATALLGQQRLWGRAPLTLPLLGEVSPCNIYAGVGLLMALVDSVGHVRAAMVGARAHGRSRIGALAQLMPYGALAGGLFLWAAVSPTDVAWRAPFPLLLGAGFQFSLLMGRIILGHLCDEHQGMVAAMWTALLLLPFAIANALSARLLAGDTLLPELWFVWGNAAFGMFAYVHFAMGVTTDITELLGIKCFSLVPKRNA